MGLKCFLLRYIYIKYDEIKYVFDLKKEEFRFKKFVVIEEVKLLFDSFGKLSLLLENLDNDDVIIVEFIKWVEKFENENERLILENNRLSIYNDMLFERFVRW